jgi:CheY-like chemotaxis protein
LRVLVVDDVAEMRRLLRLILEAEGGTEVLEAGSGEEALEIVEHHDVDLVVMDQSMPGMSGTACTGALRERRPGLEVVAFTSAADGEAAFLRAGAAAHFTKPEVDPLIAFVRERAAAGDGRDGRPPTADGYRSGE